MWSTPPQKSKDFRRILDFCEKRQKKRKKKRFLNFGASLTEKKNIDNESRVFRDPKDIRFLKQILSASIAQIRDSSFLNCYCCSQKGQDLPIYLSRYNGDD